MYRKLSPSSLRGFTALELIIVLVIGFSIIAMSANKMGDLFNNSKVTRAVDSIMQLNTSLSSLQGTNGLDAITVPIAIENDLVPKTLKRNAENNALSNEWEGAVTFNNNNGEFSINYAGIPKKCCTKLANALINSGALTLHINEQVLTSNITDIMDRCNANPTTTLVISFNNDPGQGQQQQQAGPVAPQ